MIILTTSNITGAIDLAFVDRADIKQYIGLPSAMAIYKIYHSCLTELMKVKFALLLSLPNRRIFYFTNSHFVFFNSHV